jgi:hypothetical protein
VGIVERNLVLYLIKRQGSMLLTVEVVLINDKVKGTKVSQKRVGEPM